MKDLIKIKRFKANQRKKRTRTKIAVVSDLPRLSVFRSAKHFYMQIIDDKAGKTICACSDRELKLKNKKPLEVAGEVGKGLAQKAIEKKVKNVVFDRGQYKYHGRVKAAAEAARVAGLKF